MMEVRSDQLSLNILPLILATAGIQRKKPAEGRRYSPSRPDAAPWWKTDGLRLSILRRIPACAGMSGETWRSSVLGALSLVALLGVSQAHAVEPDEMLKDPVLEARARAVSAGLRCLVCQNQSIDDSAAPLARDLRVIVREHLVAGDSDAEIRRYLVARYGDFVLLKPPFEPATWLLWGTPFFVVLTGGAALLLRRRPRERSTPLSTDERARLDALLRSEGG